MQVMSNWLNKEVSFYKSHRDINGKPATYLDILHSQKNTDILQELRALDFDDPNYSKRSSLLKSKLECYAPAALLKSRKSGDTIVIEKTGIMQMDFDYKDVKDYDLAELKQAIFKLPFVGYCGLSCRGRGIYALVLIAEPERLSEYAKHCFEVFKSHGINPDESKGQNFTDLRYISFDENRLIRKNPKPLQITNFRAKERSKKDYACKSTSLRIDSPASLINKHLRALRKVQPGKRWPTVQIAAFALGGLSNPELLEKIKEAISNNDSFSGQEDKYIRCAEDCYNAGSEKIFITPTNPEYWQ